MTVDERLDKMTLNAAAGEIFRITRVAYGYKLDEMATFLEISKSMLSLIEKGQRRVTKDILEKYLRFFEVEETKFEKTQEKVLNLVKKKACVVDIIYAVVKMLRKH